MREARVQWCAREILAKAPRSSGGSGEEVHCGFCGVGIVEDVICCSFCSGQFHSDIACVGVDEDIITCLLIENTGALQYYRYRCRSVSDGSAESIPGHSGMVAVFEQLLQVVGALTRRVGESRQTS